MSYRVKRSSTLPRCLKGSHSFTYEQVRSAVRKYIRANYQTQPQENPPIGLYGFSISRV